MIYITGDTHRQIDNRFLQLEDLTKNDYLIILGDFGGIWNGNDKYFMPFLKNQNYNILFIDGNHENHKILNEYPIEMWNGGKIHRIENNIIHLMRGQIFNINNLSFFTFGGAYSIDKNIRTEFIDWWKEEEGNYEEMNEGLDNLSKYNNKVDYILTHAGPKTPIENYFKCLNKNFNGSLTESYLDEIYNSVDYKHWYCGHYHENTQLDWFNNNESKNCNITILYNKIVKI